MIRCRAERPGGRPGDGYRDEQPRGREPLANQINRPALDAVQAIIADSNGPVRDGLQALDTGFDAAAREHFKQLGLAPLALEWETITDDDREVLLEAVSDSDLPDDTLDVLADPDTTLLEIWQQAARDLLLWLSKPDVKWSAIGAAYISLSYIHILLKIHHPGLADLIEDPLWVAASIFVTLAIAAGPRDKGQ